MADGDDRRVLGVRDFVGIHSLSGLTVSPVDGNAIAFVAKCVRSCRGK